MKTAHYLLLLLSLFTSGVTLADPPLNHRADRYRELYLNSPITDAPPEKSEEPEVNDLPDWVLVGVTKYVTGTKIRLMNVKDRSRLVIPSPEATELGFSVKGVVQDRNYIENTVVTLKKGGIVGEVRFDPKFLVLKKVAGPSSAPSPRAEGRQAVNPNARPATNRPPTPPGVGTQNTRANRTNPNPPRTGQAPPPARGANGAQPNSSNPRSPGSTNIPRPSASPAPASTPRSAPKRTRYVPRPRG